MSCHSESLVKNREEWKDQFSSVKALASTEGAFTCFLLIAMVIDQLEKVRERLAAPLPEILFAAFFWRVGFKISPLSLQKLRWRSTVPTCPLMLLFLAQRPSWSSVAVPCFCTLFSWMDLRAAGNADDQGVATVGLMLGIMQLFLPLSLMVVQPVGNTAHRRTGSRDSWLILD